MTVAVDRARNLLADFDFETLFIEELGWDRYDGALEVVVDGDTYRLSGFAVKRGVAAFVVEDDLAISERGLRQRIERQVEKSVHEHVIVFVDAARTAQVWQWVRRAPGVPTASRETKYRVGQTGEVLVQKLRVLAFTLDEEEALTVVDVAQRARQAFDVEQVTRRFYERFNAEHAAFASFVTGITEADDLAWYASVTLNRLMFVYFVQKKGFLDGDPDYLRNRLAAVRAAYGANSFFAFYRHFLLRLFHDGLGSDKRTDELDGLLGDVPYLNGGLFEVHTLEERYPSIEIPDGAFEQLFDFFDAYQWHLDDRPVATDNEINPDVLGYIFEKYINQKELGAYYTQPDVTGYMATQSIVPWLLARVGLLGGPRLVELLQSEPSRYVFEAALSDEPLPGESTEDTQERLLRSSRLVDTLSSVESVSHAELQGWNLDLLKLAADAIATEPSGNGLREIYETLRSITVIDPTCGSGAFLFAAANVLAKLTRACLYSARLLLEREALDDAEAKYWRTVLTEIESHPSEEYFVLRGIILNNLFGVDLMDEAVEICKLRLFLKLAAQLSSASEIEPLPDIDFNIRSGNALIGFSTTEELTSVLDTTLDVTGGAGRIRDALDAVEAENHAYHALQQDGAASADEVHAAKGSLTLAVTRLGDEMDAFLASSHGLTPETEQARLWRDAHHPFHWIVDFHSVVRHGGFDIILGNPPYVELPKDWSRDVLSSTFSSVLDTWSRDEDLCTLVVERSLRLLAEGGSFAMILPLSVAFSTKRPFRSLREVLATSQGHWFFSHYDRIPSALFGNEVRTRCTIAVFNREGAAARFTTPLLRWTADARPGLFQLLRYSKIDVPLVDGIAKVGSQLQADTLAALLLRSESLAIDLVRSVSFSALANSAPKFPEDAVYVGGTAYNWFPVWREIPETTDLRGRPSLPARTAGFLFDSAEDADVVFALLASSLGYWWWAVASDGFNLKKWLLNRFPLSLRSVDPSAKTEVAGLGAALRIELKKHYVYKDNRGRIGNFFLPGCRTQTRAIDAALADAVPELSKDFFADISEFNDRFSRANPTEESAADGEGDA